MKITVAEMYNLLAGCPNESAVYSTLTGRLNDVECTEEQRHEIYQKAIDLAVAFEDSEEGLQPYINS